MVTQAKKKRSKKNTPTSFLLKKGDKFYMVPASVVDTLTPEEAFRLGLIAKMEQRKQLLEDALKGDHYINDIKVVEGLEVSLRRLEELHPFIKQQIETASNNKFNKIGRC